MSTFYSGYRNVLRGRSDPKNTYTGKLGVYSNWDLMNPDHVFDGAPDTNHTIGTGYSPHGLQMSRWFLGLEPAGTRLKNPGILHPDIYQGRYPVYEFRGLAGAAAFQLGYGHLERLGPMAEYASLGLYYYGLVNQKTGALRAATLGHIARYPGTVGAANSFGAFSPYLYKGLDPALPDATLGHIVYAARTNPNDTDHYGFEHSREWFGVPSAKAL